MRCRTIAFLSFLLLLSLASCSPDQPTAPVAPASDPEAPDLVFADKAVQRPFSDYTDTQGTFCYPDGAGGCIDFEPPMKNFWGMGDPSQDYYFNALFEYLGNADIWLQEQSGGTISLGTDITGAVTERPLLDGRALIQINVHARNILTWVTVTEDYYLDPLAFGYRVGDVLVGAPPALGDLHFVVRFIVPEQNAPIPDLFQLLLLPEPGQEILHVSIEGSATGILHESSGYPEGTLGRVRVVQVFPRVPEGGYTPMGWQVERLEIQAIGRP